MTIQNEMTYETAIRKARFGEMEFQQDIKYGNNVARYRTPTGQRKEKVIYIK